jgi:4-hydroxy-4-methyl-2-oxoglutarate aldolase
MSSRFIDGLEWRPRATMPRGLMIALLATWFVSSNLYGQVFTLTRDQLIQYTAQNPYERFPDGRPKVPDAVLEKVKGLSAEEVLGLNFRGYRNQWEAGFHILHPGRKLVGRAFTLQLMPLRPDVSDVDQAARKAKGQIRLSHQTALDMLQPGDVFVADACGAAFGGIVGDNLAYYIWKTTGTGFVIDGAIRDLEGIAPFEMAGYYRLATPPAIHDLMVTGINVPVRIGGATVMPGDIVFGDREGVYFIPPHMVKEVLDVADVTHIHDEWTKKKFDEGKYKSTDIYGSPHDPALIKEYEDYLKQKLGTQAYEEYKKRRPPQAPQGQR